VEINNKLDYGVRILENGKEVVSLSHDEFSTMIKLFRCLFDNFDIKKKNEKIRNKKT